MIQMKFLATATKELGAWLQALPVSVLGLRLDDHVLLGLLWV